MRSGQVGWLPDGSGFFHGRLAEGYEKRPRAERFLDVNTYLRRLADPAADAPVFGPGLHPEVSIERSAGGAVFVLPQGDLVAAMVYHGVDRNRSLYLAELAAVLAGKPRWRKVFDKSDQVNSIAAGGRFLYLKSAKDAPRFKVLRLDLPAADLATAKTLLAAGEDVVAELAAAKEGLYVTRRKGPAKTLVRFPHAEQAAPEMVALPLEGGSRRGGKVHVALAIVEQVRRRLTQARIARSLGISESTVSRTVGLAGLSKRAALQPSEPVARYEHAAQGAWSTSTPRHWARHHSHRASHHRQRHEPVANPFQPEVSPMSPA